MEFLLVFVYHDGSSKEYYGGGSYVVDGEKYAVVPSRKNAKRFKSRKNAENAHKKLQLSCVNTGGEF